MRVTIAGFVCLMALLRVDGVSAADGGGRSMPAPGPSVCGEPTRLVEVSMSRDSIGIAPATSDNSEEGTLWCLSPDDPRCSPLSHDATSWSLGQIKLGCAAGAPQTPPACEALAAHSCGWEYSGSARDGVLGRLERPPR